MINRKGKGPSSRDLLVCFPTRAHLALMPKPACSPRQHLHRHHLNHLRKSIRGSGGGSMVGHASPYTWPGTKEMSSDNLSEPTSPKVTCAGQIKVRPSTRSCKNWQTVMEEIERLHNNRKNKPTWMESLGFKKEVMQFLTCLRSIKLDFRCLGAFSHVDITSDDEEDDNEDNNNKESSQNHDHQDHDQDINEEVSSQTMFSKWFMVLQENQDCGAFEKSEKCLKSKETEDHHHPCLPPANALLLMRCRSAPAKSWMEEKEEEKQQQQESYGEYDDHNHDQEVEQKHANEDEKLEPKEIKFKRKSLSELMKNESDFYKLSIDVAKETWVIGGIHKDSLSRSRTWKR